VKAFNLGAFNLEGFRPAPHNEICYTEVIGFMDNNNNNNNNKQYCSKGL